MQLHTKVNIPNQSPEIDYNANILSLGSCFAENVARKFGYFKFQNTVNPFGIIFHPLVLERLIERCYTERSRSAFIEQTYSEKDIFHHNDRWYSFDAHSALSATSKEAVITNLNTASKTFQQSIKIASHIIITLGTAWGYVEKNSAIIVANCHKLPQNQFEKQLASPEDIQNALESISEKIKKINPKATVVFTVSPVRHQKDGLVENMRSKANLISAVHTIISTTSNTTYFPAYEIVMDELRDYRFYGEDMLHPNATAVNYVWERFSKAWLSEGAFSISKKVEEIQKGLAHKAFNPESESHQKFQQKLQKKIESLQKEFPQISF